MVEYQEPDWDAILLDLVFWQVVEINGWQISDLPTDVLCNLWHGLRERHCRQLNAQNHSAAILVDLDQAKATERSNLEINAWLPYNLDNSVPQISASIVDVLLDLRDRRQLPAKMLQDLYKHKLLSP